MLYESNIYENKTGVLPVSPVLLSGKYKIFVSKDNKLFLDDYNGRRVLIDSRQKFLPQVANFLKIDTSDIDNDKLRYGGYRNNTSLSWHTTIYLSDNIQEYPETFVFNTLTYFPTKNHFDKLTVPNINNKAIIFKYSDLKKIGLFQIFEEINTTINGNMFFNSFEDSFLMLNGYSIKDECPVQKYYDLKYLQANQTDFNYVNSKILEAYKDFQIIYPRFLNVEFEFDFQYSFKQYNSSFYQNFYCFYSKYKFDTIENIDYPTILSTDTEFTRIFSMDMLNQKKNNPEYYDVIINNLPITKYSVRNPQVRFDLKQLNSGDFIRIHHKDNSVIFEYVFSDEDFKNGNTIFSVLKQALNKISLETNNMFYFQLNNRYKTNQKIEVICEFAETDEFVEEYYISLSNNFRLLDYTKFFRRIGINDYSLESTIEKEQFDAINKVKLNNDWLEIEDKFWFNGYPILRFTDANNINNDKLNIISIYGKEKSKLIQFKPIPWLRYNDDLVSEKQYNNLNYVGFLEHIFPRTSSNYNNTLQIYRNNIRNEDIFPFVNKEQTEHVSDVSTENYNTSKVQSIIFNSIGNGTHKNPVIFSLDKRWYEKSNLINYNLLDADDYRYHWFLIKIDYDELLNDKRYFKDKPQITSRLVKSFENSLYCETVFLGVKYRLPSKYTNYKFAVYLNYQNKLNPKLHYEFKVDDDKQEIFLEVNKFFDFNDIIRGGFEDNKPFVDLSFIYNCNKAFNDTSTNIFDFDYGGFLICDKTIPVMWNGQILHDWKVFDNVTNKWYICIKKSLLTYTRNLTELIDNTVGSDYTYYLYSSITDKYGRKFNYLSIKFIIKNIQQVTDDYIWAENLIVRFFDSDDYYVEIEDDNHTSEYYVINDNHDLVSTERLLNNQVINKVIISPKDGNQIKLKFLNNNYDFDLKKEYWGLSSKTFVNNNGKLETQRDVFTFPEFNLVPNVNDIYNKYLDDIDLQAKQFEFSIFERNQLWLLIRELSSINIQLKRTLNDNKIFNDLLLYHLEKHSINESIQIANTDRFVKIDLFEPDLNVVIWNESINRIQRISTYYNPLLTECLNEYDFQKQLYLNNSPEWKLSSIQNIFNKHYYGENISATGIYKEVFGNICSSMFVIYDNLIIECLIDNVNYSYYNLLCSEIIIDKLIIQNNNEEYIQQFNRNINEYIYETFVKELIKIYKLSETVDIRNNKRLEFIDNNQEYTVSITNYDGINKIPVKLIFSRIQ